MTWTLSAKAEIKQYYKKCPEFYGLGHFFINHLIYKEENVIIKV